MTIPPDALLRLRERGRAAGQITVADLAKELPVDSMDAEDVALVIAHLEEAGIPVTLDENLRRPAGGAPATPPPSIDLPRQPRDTASGITAPRGDASGTRGPAPASHPAPARPRYANGTVLVAGILAVVILLAVLWMFGR